MLQLQHEQQNVLEVKKFRQNARLREAEIAHAQVKQHLDLEHFKLELMSDGKLQPETQKVESALLDCPTPSFDIAVNLRLVPKFNETS